MARPRTKDDEEEAVASIDAPLPGAPVSNLTPFERDTLARQAEERRQFAETEKRRKANDLRTEQAMAAERNVLADKVKVVLLEHYQDDPTAEDTVALMMRQIGPVLAAGKEGGRRERTRFMRPIAAKPKAAA